jgi:hypothetical protein
MGFSVFEKAHTSPPYGCLPSADIGQVVYCGSFTRVTKGLELCVDKSQLVHGIRKIETTRMTTLNPDSGASP